MAKGFAETHAQCRDIVEDVRKGVFSPVYLLMGEEPYYPEQVYEAIVKYALDDSERDFNQRVWPDIAGILYPLPFWSYICVELPWTRGRNYTKT